MFNLQSPLPAHFKTCRLRGPRSFFSEPASIEYYSRVGAYCVVHDHTGQNSILCALIALKPISSEIADSTSGLNLVTPGRE